MTVKLVTLYPLLYFLTLLVELLAGFVSSLLRSDHPYESAAGFQHALPQGPLSQSPLSPALSNNSLGRGPMSKMWETIYTYGCSLCSFPFSPWKAGSHFRILQAGGISCLRSTTKTTQRAKKRWRGMQWESSSNIKHGEGSIINK